MTFENVTPNVKTDITIRGCNPSYVVTSDGVVVIDTPQLPTRAVAMRAEVEAIGPIRYLINTEHHVDHIFGNYYFRGMSGKVVMHQGLYDNFMVSTPLLDPFDYAAEAIPMSDPEAASIFPERDVYYQDPNKGQIVFTGDLRLEVGDHTFNLIWTPGHTPGQLAVHVPQERVVFTGDTVFSEVQTWVMASDVDQWIAALNTISRLDVDYVVPGHGPVTDLKDYIQKHNAGILWDKLSANEV
jgi:cyclase